MSFAKKTFKKFFQITDESYDVCNAQNRPIRKTYEVQAGPCELLNMKSVLEEPVEMARNNVDKEAYCETCGDSMDEQTNTGKCYTCEITGQVDDRLDQMRTNPDKFNSQGSGNFDHLQRSSRHLEEIIRLQQDVLSAVSSIEKYKGKILKLRDRIMDNLVVIDYHKERLEALDTQNRAGEISQESPTVYRGRSCRTTQL